MNIAQAAAAGFLKIPDKNNSETEAPSQLVEPVPQPTTLPKFTFGGAPTGKPGELKTSTEASIDGLTPLATSSNAQAKPFVFQANTISDASTKKGTPGTYRWST